MIHSHHLSNFLGLLRNKNKIGQITFTYNYLTTQILANVKFLLAFNIINGYSLQLDPSLGRGTITIFLKYSIGEDSVIKNIRFFSRPGCTRALRLKDVKRLVKTKMTSEFGGIYVLSTSSGIFSARECLQRRIGGILLYYVSL